MEKSSESPALGIYRSVKLFLQPIKLCEISICNDEELEVYNN